MPSIITEGFLSKNPAIITEGYAVLEELIYTGTGTIVVSGDALTSGPLGFIYSGSGIIQVSGLSQSFYTSSFIFVPSGTIIIDGEAATEFEEIFFGYTGSGEIIIKGHVSSQFIETIIERIVHPEELQTFTDRLINPSSYDKVSGKNTGVKTGTGSYPDLFTKQSTTGKGKYTGTKVPDLNYFDQFKNRVIDPKLKGKTTHLEGDKTSYFDWLSEKKKR